MFAYFERIIPPFPEQEPVQPPGSLVQFCLHYTRGMWRPILFLSLFSATVAIAEASMFGLMGWLVDWLGTVDPQTVFKENISVLIGLSIFILLIVPALILITSMLLNQAILANYPMSVRWLAHRYLLKQSLSFYQNDYAGRVATKVMQTSLAVRDSVVKLLDVMVYIFIYVVTMIILIGKADHRLVLPVLIWLVVYIGIQIYFIPRLRNVSSEVADARSTMTGRVVDSYTNIQTVKLFADTQSEADYAREGMQEFMDAAHKQRRLVTLFEVVLSWFNYLLLFSIAGAAIYLWSIGEVSVGSIALAIALSLRMNGMSHWIMREVGALFENIGTVIDGMRTLSKPQSVTDAQDAKKLTVARGGIRFNDISFHYGKSSGVIEGLTLDIKPGERIGLVGRSGAGKSTLVNLLLRFYDLEKGCIEIDGQDIAKVEQDSLRANIGMVSQDTMLLHRSIRENILYGRPDATEAELISACRKAEAFDFIQELCDPYGNTGFDAQVGERGVKLSGGQRQRIAIARVLLKDAPLLILDEATSALDSEAEAAIQENLDQLMEGKTVIAIAHRLSTIAALDRLVIMDDGKIVEQGAHRDLVASGGIYAQLWNRQTGGFLSD
ncbi:ABC transporter ATP-binding protein [Reinekea marinisedimentorum]|uniref:ATP-binding cassette subfamily B multidrug efflux pump n=1 Tax=Reinekea marinisedimentorum TaxID=230495 RepID=A0A4R3I362_9GAMM|nr:ABC transporter ATP-binding protein [Reinekea marinisedimentorum]TCS40120.1 ATP-binding cassette subfamily B multidrug efflux pump [Reinekea marinisedimentorum]